MPKLKPSLKPKVKKVVIGNRPDVMTEINIYPLSMADQMEFTEVLSEGLKALFPSDNTAVDDTVFFNHIATFIQDNIAVVLGYLIDEKPEDVLKSITNEQVLEIAEVVYQVNYASVSKKVKSLLGRTGIVPPSRRQFRSSLKSTLDTDLNTSTSEGTEKEE